MVDSRSEDRNGTSADQVTDLLREMRAGDEDALDRLLPLVYHQLRALAREQRRRWTGDETLDTTALVHEAYLRLVGRPTPEWESRAHFMCVAARAMRQILIDYARRQHRAKRGGALARVPLDAIDAALEARGEPAATGAHALVALDEALRRLEQRDPRQGRIVECRFFGGMSIEETAAALDVSPATVKRGWSMAQAWLHREVARAMADA